jgi:hypothetical protein
MGLYTSTGKMDQAEGNTISREDYAHSQVALFYQLKGSNFRHVGCEIKSKQGVSFGVIFSRNGISFGLIHFSGTGVESHITSDVAIVFEVGCSGLVGICRPSTLSATKLIL